MAELKNSTRSIDRATYCPTYGSFANGSGKADGKAIDKATFIAALNIHKTEVERVRAQLGENPPAPVAAALAVIESMVTDLSPDATLRHANDFTPIDAKVLTDLAQLLADVRDQLVGELGDAMTALYGRFQEARLKAGVLNQPDPQGTSGQHDDGNSSQPAEPPDPAVQ